MLLLTRGFEFLIDLELAKQMGIGKLALELEPTGDDFLYSSPARREYFMKHAPLQKAALKGDWEAAVTLLKDDPNLLKTRITQGGETALHLAALEGHQPFVSNLLAKMGIADTAIKNKKESTALCFAAAAGHVDIAVQMVKKNHYLPIIKSPKGVTPLYMAALQGHKDMADYLFPLSDFSCWDLEDQVTLLTTSIESGLYDVAMKILGEKRTLAVATNGNGETALELLARSPSAFCADNLRGPSETIIGFMKWSNNKESAVYSDACRLFDCLWDSMIREEDSEAEQIISENTSRLPFIAAESGNDVFLVMLIDRYPDFLYQVNQSKHTIFHIAVKNRYVRIFNLIYELNGVKDLITTYVDEDGENNILHLAAKLAPQHQLNGIPGRLLQVQREVLWYKEVEKIVQPYYRNMKNSNNQTPHDLFLAEHENLIKEAENSMKQIAISCMLVTLLITTLVFATTFTHPGGYNNYTGAPILKNKKLFMVFPTSQAAATLSSLISMLMFLSILTSRYDKTDFLNSLPLWLVIGVAALLISIVAMMVEFCTRLLFFQYDLVAIAVILVLFASVPLMFVILNYPLLVTILGSWYNSRWLFKSENRLFSRVVEKIVQPYCRNMKNLDQKNPMTCS